MISADQARQAAVEALDSGLAARELANQPDGVWDEAVLVHDISSRPSYWLVPYRVEGRVVGFARVLGDGRLFAIGSTGRRGRRAGDYPREATGLSGDQARLAVAGALEPGEVATAPIFVHDGPPGREAWLVETRRDGEPHRWVFVTAAGTYQRPAGQLLGDVLEA